MSDEVSQEAKSTEQVQPTEEKVVATQTQEAEKVQEVEQALPDPEEAPSAQQGGIFGITTDTTHTNTIPIPSVMKLEKRSQTYPNGYEFPVARLVNVVANKEFEKKDQSKVSILQFIFKDTKGRQHMHFEWEIEQTDNDFTKKITSMNSRIKHIFVEAFGEKAFPQEGIGTKAVTFGDFFEEVANAFNSRKDQEGNKVYAKGNYFLKLTYYKTNLGFPLSPPFLQKMNPTAPVCTLSINAKYDKIEPEQAPNNAANMPGAGGTVDPSALPDFNNEYN